MGTLSGVILLVLIILVVYNIWMRPYFIRTKHLEDGVGVVTTDYHTPESLLQFLKDNNFSYPEMKNIRINEQAQVVIEGKYTSHVIGIEESKLFVGHGAKGGPRRRAKCMKEAIVINHYLNKLINPTAPVDAYKEFDKFKRTRNIPTIIATSLILVIGLSILMWVAKEYVQNNSSYYAISQSYLTDYSSDITIDKAFNKYFDNGRWVDYEEGIYDYVDFRGTGLYGGEPAKYIIKFRAFTDSFQIESINVSNINIANQEIPRILKAIFDNASE